MGSKEERGEVGYWERVAQRKEERRLRKLREREAFHNRIQNIKYVLDSTSLSSLPEKRHISRYLLGEGSFIVAKVRGLDKRIAKKMNRWIEWIQSSAKSDVDSELRSMKDEFDCSAVTAGLAGFYLDNPPFNRKRRIY